MFCEDLAVEVEESCFDDGGDSVRIDLTERMIFTHVAGDASGVESQVRDIVIAIHQAGSEAVGAVEVVCVEGRGDFIAGRFIVDVIA